MPTEFIIILIIGIIVALGIVFVLWKRPQQSGGSGMIPPMTASRNREQEVASPPAPAPPPAPPHTLNPPSSQSLSQAEIANQVMEGMMMLSGGERGFLMLKNEATGDMEVASTRGIDKDDIQSESMEISRKVADEVTQSGEAILTDSASQDSRYEAGESVVGFSLRSMMAVPLKKGDEVVGVAYVDNRLKSGIFKSDDIEQMKQFASNAVRAIDGDSFDTTLTGVSGGIAPPSPAPEKPSQPPQVAEPAESDVQPKRDDKSSLELEFQEAVEGSDKMFIDEDELDNQLGVTQEIEQIDKRKKEAKEEAPAEPEPESKPVRLGSGSTSEADEDDEVADTGSTAPVGDIDEEESDPLDELSNPGGAGDFDENSTKEIEKPISLAKFSAYYPREASAQERSGLYVYSYMAQKLAEIEQDIQKFEAELGGSVPRPKTAKQSVAILQGTPVTVIPESDELTFEPASLTKTWHGDWTRYEFDFRPDESQIGETAFIRVSIVVGGIEIASIKGAIEIVKGDVATFETPTDGPQPMIARSPNPLADAKLQNADAEHYQNIFISYSRKDKDVAHAYKFAQQALGNEVFIDVDNLRSGEDWQAGLAKAIDEADVLQLFWSEHSAESEFCRYEWEYALQYKCAEDNCVGFIRPVYWENPMPASPPEPLRHLNFKYIPFKQE